MCLVQLLKLHHFKITRRTFIIELNQLQLASINPEPIKTKNLNQLSLHEWRELKTLFNTNYSQYHETVNALAHEIGAEQLFNHLKNIDLEQSNILLKNNHHTTNSTVPSIMAYFLIGNSDSDSIEVAYLGGQEQSRFQDYLPFFQYEFKVLHQKYKTIYFEADDTDYYAFTLAKTHNCNLSNPFYTLIKDIHA